MVVNLNSAYLSLAALALVGCEGGNPFWGAKSEAFGISYDDCILKGIGPGGEAHAVAEVSRACRRVWEQEGEKPASASVRISVGDRPSVRFFLENKGDFIATHAQVGLRFNTEGGVETLTWDFPVFVEPGESEEEYGTFEGNKVPSLDFEIVAEETKFTRFIAIKRANVRAKTVADR